MPWRSACRRTDAALSEFAGTATSGRGQTPEQRERLRRFVAEEYQAGRSLRVLGELTDRSQTVLCTCQEARMSTTIPPSKCLRRRPETGSHNGIDPAHCSWEARRPVGPVLVWLPGRGRASYGARKGCCVGSLAHRRTPDEPVVVHPSPWRSSQPKKGLAAAVVWSHAHAASVLV